MNTIQKNYNDAINLMSHLILTKPKAVVRLLAKHKLVFKGVPNRAQVIEAVVEKMKSGDDAFVEDIGKLITTHIQFKGQEMLALEATDFDSYDESEEDEFWGTLASKAVGIVGGLFKKKKKRRKRSNTSSGALLASQSSSKARAQANQIRLDMQRKMMEMESKLKAAHEQQLAKIKADAIQARKEQEEKNKKKQTQLYMIGGAMAAILLVGGVLIAGSRQGRPPMQYMTPPTKAA